MSSMPICLTCGEEQDIEIVTPCPRCKGAQNEGDADCASCGGMGQAAFEVCGCPSPTGCLFTLEDDPIGWCSTHESYVDKCPDRSVKPREVAG
jgi:hypothetical protein